MILMTSLRQAVVGFALAGLLLGAATASAGTLTTADGNGADTFASNDSSSGPMVAHGGEVTFNVRSLVTITSSGPPLFENIITGTRARVGVLRFDVSQPNTPTQNVRLQLTEVFGRRARTLDVYTLTDQTGANWDEVTASYSDLPGLNPADPGRYEIDLTEATLLGTLDVIDNRVGGVDTPTVISSNPATLPLDGLIATAQAGNGLITLYLAFNPLNTASDPDWTFATKETTAGHLIPTLVPEPSSLALGLATCLGICAGFRRRD